MNVAKGQLRGRGIEKDREKEGESEERETEKKGEERV